ncbi:hypothetical protein [Nostoc sp.]
MRSPDLVGCVSGSAIAPKCFCELVRSPDIVATVLIVKQCPWQRLKPYRS